MQAIAQAEAGAGEENGRAGGGHAGEFGGFAGVELVDFAQREEAAQRGGQAFEAESKKSAEFGAEGRVVRTFGERAHRMRGVDAPRAVRSETGFERVVTVFIGGRRGGRIRAIGAAAAGAEAVEEFVPEDADEPGTQRGATAEGVALRPRGEEAVLHGLLGFMVVV